MTDLYDLSSLVNDEVEAKVETLIQELFGTPTPVSIPVPPPSKVELKVQDGDLVLCWSKPANVGYACSYIVTLTQSQGRDVVWTDITENTEYRFPKGSYDPVKLYYGCVAVQKKGTEQRSEPQKSTRKMLCERMEGTNVYVDDSRALRDGYKVYVGYIKAAGDAREKVAVKVLDSESSREVKHLIKLTKSPMDNVVAYRESGNIKGIGKRIFIAMELCDENTLAEIVSGGLLKDNPVEIKKMLHHMMRGLSHIHKKGILHRDLKLQNVLRSLDGRNMKISDFGFSKQMEDGQSKVSKSALEIGTDGWGSPEHYSGNQFMSRKSDIFSAGLIYCYVLSKGQHAYGVKPYKWKSRIIDREPLTLPAFHCEEPALAEDLVKSMLEYRPDDRPYSEQVLAHPFFWSHERKLDFIHHVDSYNKRNRKREVHIISRKISFEMKTLNEIFCGWVGRLRHSGKDDAEFLYDMAIGKVSPPNHRVFYSNSVRCLIRFIRNVEEHYTDHKKLRQLFNNTHAEIWSYFSSIYPDLLHRLFRVFYKHLSVMEEDSSLLDLKNFLSYEPPYEPLESFEDVPLKKRKMV